MGYKTVGSRALILCSINRLIPKPLTSALPAPARYLENVPAIVPLLEKEYRNAAQRLAATQEELTELAPDKCDASTHLFCCGYLNGDPHTCLSY